ncbi:MAG: hypothetical protein JJU00_19610 [Opitutales bacterium]|nr:hypothetical protein [Opitutales bacterium]
MIGIVISILLIAGLAALAVNTRRPFVAALVYSSANLAVRAVFIFAFNLVDATSAELVAGFAVSFAIHLLLGYAVAWLLVRHEGKPWALALCTLLGIALIIL